MITDSHKETYYLSFHFLQQFEFYVQEPHSVWDLQIFSRLISVGVLSDMSALATQNFLFQSSFISLFHIGDSVINNLMYDHGTVVNFVHSFALCVLLFPLSCAVRVRPKDSLVFSRDNAAVAQSLQRLFGIPCCE